MVKKQNTIKLIGLGVTVLGFLVNCAGDWVQEKQIEASIEEKINEHLGGNNE